MMHISCPHKFYLGVFAAMFAMITSLDAATLPAWQAELKNGDLRISEWLFQPGESTALPPRDGEWESVRVPFLWTSGPGRMQKPVVSEWAKQPKSWIDYDNGWFERTVSIPAEWAGQRVWVAFDQIEGDGLLWVDGGKPMFIEGPEARVDITSQIKPGKEAKLRVWVTRWWKDVPKTMEQDPLRNNAIKDTARANKGGVEAVRREIPAGLSGLVRFEVRPLAGEITGVFARPSVREKALYVDIETILAAPSPNAARIRVEVVDPSGQGTALGPLPAPVTVPLSPTVKVSWASPRLWELGDGYLYELRVTLLDAAGRAVHTADPVAFGYREVWVEGRDIMLNAHPVHLRMAPVIFPQYPSILFWEGIGFNAFQWHPNSVSWFSYKGRRSLVVVNEDNPGMRSIKPDVIEQADRRGLAMLMPAPNVSMIRTAMSTPEGIRAYERECRLWFARLRNHPSIIMWFPSMNVGSGSRENPERIGALPNEEDHIAPWYTATDNIIKSVDPTRIVTHHCGAAGEIDYPNQYLNFMPLQERIEFPSRWAERPDARPWGAIEHGTPWIHNFSKWHRVPQFAEWHAVYFGDRAYTAETDGYIDFLASVRESGREFIRSSDYVQLWDTTLHGEWEKLFTEETNRAWRAWGVAGGWKPWNFELGYGVPPQRIGSNGRVNGDDFFYTELTEAEASASLDTSPAWANSIYHAYRETMQPLLVYLGGPPDRFTIKDHAFTAGEQFKKSIVAVWDGGTTQTLDATWTLEVHGRPELTQSGHEILQLSPGQILKHALSFTTPAVSVRTDAVLKLTVKPSLPGRGLKSITDSLDLTFWPRSVERVVAHSAWAIYDPAPGAPTASWLKKNYNINATLITTAADLKRSHVDVLVIGREALTYTKEKNLPVTADHIARGLRVLFLEQKPEELEALGLRIQDIVTRVSFPRVGNHRALAGLAPSDLSNWRGVPDLLPKTKEGMKAWPLARPPHWGNQGAVASVVIETPHHGAFTPLVDAEFDLAYSPLLEWRHGKGGILFSQFDLVNRSGGEPVAERLAVNLLRTVDTPYEQTQRKRIRYLGNDEGWSYVSELGFADERLEDTKALASLVPADDLLVIGPDTGKELPELLKAARAFSSNGGVFLVLPQKPTDLSAASTQVLSLKTESVTRARIVPEPASILPLLSGVGPQLTHWRTMVPQDTFTATSGAKRGLGGLLLDYSASTGRQVYSQLDWRTFEADDKNLERPKWNTAKLYSRLLTNLGVRSNDEVVSRLLEVHKSAPMVNVPYWRIWNDVAKVDPKTTDGTFPSLALRLPIESVDLSAAKDTEGSSRNLTANVQIGEGEINMPGLDLGSAGWRTYGPRASSGRVYLEWVSPAELGKIGFARSYIYSSRDREAVFAVGADFWIQFRVNGKVELDHSRQPRPMRSPFAGEFRFTAPLKEGWNLLEAKVASGSGGFGFMCMVSDPGDLEFSASLHKPENPPKKPMLPADKLLDEPQLNVAKNLLYARPLDPVDDPYRFNPW